MRYNYSHKQGRVAIALLLICLLATLLVMTLPLYNYEIAVYTKKSANTFVGDEKYNEVLTEVEAVRDEYVANGMDVTLNESVKESTTSKGKVSSIVTFTLSHAGTKSGWDFLGAGLTPSWVLMALLICLFLGAACVLGGSLGSLDIAGKDLQSTQRNLRGAGCVLLLAALLLLPVFVMCTTYTFSRQVYLCTNDLFEGDKLAFYEKLSAFLFDGTAAEDIESLLKGFSFDGTGIIWVELPCIFAMLLAAIQLRCGSISHTLLRGLLYAFVIVMCIFILYPYYVMLVTAFRSNSETNDMNFLHLFPTSWKWSNLTDIVKRGVPKYLLNSLLIAGGATAIALLCGIPAAYALSRRKFKGKKVFLGFVIMSQMFSPVVLLVGIAQLISQLGLNDNIIGLMLINAAFNQAFAIWLLRGTFVAISPEMEQAARIDGCTSLGSLVRVLIPMAAPGIVTTLIFVFINAWNEYTISTVLISTATNRPITVGITQFSSFNMIEWQYLFAASLLATIPVVILFICIEKHLTSGLTAGGVKG